ncbi:MAG: hypothetical protein K2F63_07335, partial [Muribaculaceae bacterium]|nr:hypothetical protein [Muribaculaceae bacterium]
SDPTARAKVINEILATVACVDDPVKRQEYIAQCSRLFALPEDVVIPQLNIFITRRYEEQEKNSRREAARASVADLINDQPQDQPRQDSEAAADDDRGEVRSVPQENEHSVPLLNLDRDTLRPYEEMLVRYVVRYGMLYLVDLTGPDGSVAPGTVFDLIDSELALDNLKLTYPPYARIMEEVRALRHGSWLRDHDTKLASVNAEAGERMAAAREHIRVTATDMAQIDEMERCAAAETEAWQRAAIDEFDINYCQAHLCNSPDDEVRRTASELVAERYTLSRIYARQGAVETEQDQLRTLVPRAVYELRAAVINDMLKELNRSLAATPANDMDAIIDIMRRISELKAFQAELVRILGERIILPKN